MPEFEGIAQTWTPLPKSELDNRTHEMESEPGCFHIVHMTTLVDLMQQISMQLQSFHHDDDVLVVGLIEVQRDLQYRFGQASALALSFYKGRLDAKRGATQ